MFGTFRLILALLVLLNHIFAGSIFYNYGVSAVVCFFIISGYVMTLMIRNSYGEVGKSTLYFYADRFLRIYPQYFLFIVLTYFADLNWHFNYVHLIQQPTAWRFFLNALIVPLNYFMLIDAIHSYQLIPQAWSLGLEEQFYWIFPFLVLWPWWGRITTIISIVIYAIATFGFLDPELFAFRFLPGVIYMFMLGKNLAEYNQTKNKENLWCMIFIYFTITLLAIYLFSFQRQNFFSSKDVLLGFIFGFPIIAWLSRLPRRNWDEFLGRPSYGIFLCHILVFNSLNHFEVFNKDYPSFVTASTLISTVLGFAGYYLVEKMVNPFRYALRKKHMRASQQG